MSHSEFNLEHFSAALAALEESVFPIYQNMLRETHKELITMAVERGLAEDRKIAGLISSMACASFELSVQLSVILTTAMSQNNFVLDEKMIQMISEKLEQK